MQKRLDFLESLGVNDKASLGKIITRVPNMLYIGVEEVLEPRVKYLEYILGLTREEVRCATHALVRSRAAQQPPLQAPVFAATRRTANRSLVYACTLLQIGKMQMRHPKLLTNSEAMVESRLAFLFGLGLSDTAVKRIVQSHPQARQSGSRESLCCLLLSAVAITADSILARS